MYEAAQIKRQIAHIKKRISLNALGVVDIQVLINYVKTLKRQLLGVRADFLPLKATCEVYLVAFDGATNWKHIKLLEGSAVHVNNILVIARTLAKNPKQAKEEYGDFATIKADLELSLQHLIEALTATIEDVRALAAKRELAKV